MYVKHKWERVFPLHLVHDFLAHFGLAYLASAQFASVRFCFLWLGYHGTVGGVNRVKQDNIIRNIYIFNFSQHCFAVQCNICREVRE